MAGNHNVASPVFIKIPKQEQKDKKKKITTSLNHPKARTSLLPEIDGISSAERPLKSYWLKQLMARQAGNWGNLKISNFIPLDPINCFYEACTLGYYETIFWHNQSTVSHPFS